MQQYVPKISKKASLLRMSLPEDRRILCVSDIHGSPDMFRRALAKANYTPDDCLIVDGDFLERGQESLTMLHEIMRLSQRQNCLILAGNCDRIAPLLLLNRDADRSFFLPFLRRRPNCLIRQMGRSYGFDQVRDASDLEFYRNIISEHFRPEVDFLCGLPVILDTPNLLFVHGGVPDGDHLDDLDAYRCMKNDNFAEKGVVFSKWCVVGHTPTFLYRSDILSAAPYIQPGQRLISIDGGCGVKRYGQINVLIFEDSSADSWTWCYADDLPTVTALDSQTPSAESFNLRWRFNEVKVLQAGEEFSRIRHLKTGYEMEVPTDYLHRSNGQVLCEDATDYRLSVSPGDELGLIRKTSRGILAKKDGVIGWYAGRFTEEASDGGR